MSNVDRLLAAMGNMEDQYLMEALEYENRKARRFRKAFVVAIAAAVIMIGSITAVAANASWRDAIRDWLGIGEGGAAGYVEYTDKTGAIGDMQIQQLSQLCSGNQLVAWFEVTPQEDCTLDTTLQWQLHVQDESLWTDQINLSRLDVVSKTETEILLKYTVGFEDMHSVKRIPVKLFYYDSGEEPSDSNISLSEIITLEITDTPVLSGNLNLDIENTAADSSGKISQIRICSGSLEIVMDYEHFETWCDRVCVPDHGVHFMERYTGENWRPEPVEDYLTYFSENDELTLAKAFRDTWEEVTDSVLDTVKITLKNGTVLSVQGDAVTDQPVINGDSQYHSCVYRYTLLPLISLEEVESVEVMGKTVEMSLLEAAK